MNKGNYALPEQLEVTLVMRRYYLRKYPAVLFSILLINVIAYADNRTAGVSGERAAGGVAVNNTPGRGNRDIIASNEYRSYEYYRDLEKRGASSVKNTAPVKKEGEAPAGNERIIVYTVKKGDTLFRIAQNNKVTVERISELNRLDNRNRIYEGMKLRIPVSANAAKTDKAAPVKNTSSAVTPGQKLEFLWPLKKVDNFKRDGNDGVKPIGIIITGTPGAEVIASEAGVVMRTGHMRGFGRYVVVNHGERYLTVYSNLQIVNVKEGDRLTKGAGIGRISEDRTLHFQIDVAGKPRNPLEFLPGRS